MTNNEGLPVGEETTRVRFGFNGSILHAVAFDENVQVGMGVSAVAKLSGGTGAAAWAPTQRWH